VAGWLRPCELHHLVTLRLGARQIWLVRYSEHLHNQVFGVGTHSAAIHGAHLILVDFGGLQICCCVRIDSKFGFNLFELAIGANVGPNLVVLNVGYNRVFENLAPLNDGRAVSGRGDLQGSGSCGAHILNCGSGTVDGREGSPAGRIESLDLCDDALTFDKIVGRLHKL